MKSIRHLHLVGATGQIRTAVYDNREHLVVPVVAMVEGVVWAVNSDVPEFVPAEELAETPQQWNGRGCFAGHPADGGTQITANTPRTLETSFGVVFEASGSDRILSERKLEVFAWLDPVKAEQIGPEAVSVIRRLRAGEIVEVSVGCYVEAEDIDGEFNGKQYHGVWRNIVSDHLAFLGEGEKGACSIAAGCGAGRRATRHLITAEGIRREEDMQLAKPIPKTRMKAGSSTETEPNPDYVPPAPPVRSLKERIASFLSSLRDSEVGVSDRDLRYKVDAALRAIEPGYMGLSEMYPDGTDDMATPHAIYDVCPADEWMMMRRGYTLSADGSIALDANADRIEPVTTYEVVTAASAAKPCSCGGQQAHVHTPEPTVAEENPMKDRITALMSNPHNPIKNLKALEALTEAEIKALEDEAIVKAAKPITEEPKVAAAKPMTEAEALVAFPRIATIVTEHETRVAAEKTALVGQLKTAAAGAYTEEELGKMSIGDLTKLATLAKVSTVDYSGQGTVRTPAPAEDYAPPSAYDAGLKALREAVN